MTLSPTRINRGRLFPSLPFTVINNVLSLEISTLFLLFHFCKICITYSSDTRIWSYYLIALSPTRINGGSHFPSLNFSLINDILSLATSTFARLLHACAIRVACPTLQGESHLQHSSWDSKCIRAIILRSTGSHKISLSLTKVIWQKTKLLAANQTNSLVSRTNDWKKPLKLANIPTQYHNTWPALDTFQVQS